MELFTLSHKKIDEVDGWKILQVGNGEQFSTYRDNTLDNISDLNHLYLETTGIYWVWKNVHDAIKGVQQYRRRLDYKIDEIEKILKWYDIIVAKPYNFNPYLQYNACHDGNDLLQCREFVNNKADFNNYIMNGNKLYYSNSFIAKEEVFDDLCDYCFTVLDKYVDKNNFKDYNTLMAHASSIVKGANPHPDITEAQYQARICGALFERLLTLYLCSNKLGIYECREYKVL